MLNEEKIKLMTKLATYEQREGKKDLEMSKYFKGDYTGMHIIQTLITTTIAYILLVVIWVVYNEENLVNDIADLDLMEIGYKFLALYVIFVVVYAVIAKIVYSYKFRKVRESLKDYNAGLKKLEAIHVKEGKIREEIEEGGFEDYDDSFDN